MRIGILGGGQLGRMFIQNALSYPVEIGVMDSSKIAPCKHLVENFTLGDLNDYQSVIDFGKDFDYITIEIENVNVEALKELEKQGKTVVPSPKTLEIIQDKGLQKEFYTQHHLPTAPFLLLKENESIQKDQYGWFQKLRKGGYDGKGVLFIKDETSEKFNAPSVIEKAADLDKELSVIVVRNNDGETICYPTVEMVANQELNLLDYLLCPADISKETEQKAQELAKKTVELLDSAGIFAVELFLNKDGSIWLNEIAPRVHNSGHASIEANVSSQFDNMLRSVVNFPLGNPKLHKPSAMLNVIGKEDGEAKFDNLSELLKLSEVYLHLYGKKESRVGRKMGHVTVLGENLEELKLKIEKIKKLI